MKKLLYCYAVLFSACISANLFAQTPELKQIIPPSPIMTPFLRYGDYPISYSTGMANISIPLYDIKVKDFTFPISISFHASGRRTNYEISTLGVGWVLNATGFISREIRNRPDELAYHPGLEDSLADISQTNGQTDLLKEYNALLPADMTVQNVSSAPFNFLRDAEHDVYSYNVNGMSGKFVVNDLGYAVPLTAVPYHFNSYTTIIDEKGVKYEFGLTGNEKESTALTQQNSNYLATTGWYLSKITLPTGKVITFTYGSRYTDASQTDNIRTPYQEDYQLTYSNVLTSHCVCNNFVPSAGMDDYSKNKTDVRTYNTTNTGRAYTIKYLTNIDFGDGTVQFNYDMTNLRLTSMLVVSAYGLPIKSADFTYMQTPGTAGYLPNNNSTSLSSLTINGEKYVFNYYNNTLTSSTDLQAFYNNRDWWGYSNVAGNSIPVNPNPNPSDYEGTAVYGHGCTSCKTPSFFNKVSGMLKNIIYPTGGNTEFDYESNMYVNGSPTDIPQEGPGLRIAKIINDDGSGNKVTRLYRYGPLVNGVENGAGTLLYVPKPDDFRSVETFPLIEAVTGLPSIDYTGVYTMSTYTKVPVETLSEAYQVPVYYPTVTEYIQSVNGVNNGKTIYEYTIPEPVLGSSGTLGAQSFTIKDWTGSKLYSKKSYKYRPLQNDYQLVQWDQNGYTTIAYNKIHQMRFRRKWQLNYDPSYTDRYEDLRFAGIGYQSPVPLGFPYDVIDWPIESGAEVQTKQLATSYVDGVPAVTTETDLFYDNPAHLQPTRTETFTSKANEKLITQTSYVQDFSYPGSSTPIQQGITNFKNRYIIAPVEVSRFKSPLSGTPRRLISSQRYTFNPSQPVIDSILSIDMVTPLTDFVPLSITSGGVLTKDGRYSKKIDFDKYDTQSNLLQQHIENGVPVSYIWGYNGQYPIAECKNASTAEFYYDGFEENMNGTTIIPHTGRQYTTTPTVNWTVPTNGRTYQISYWYYNGTAWKYSGEITYTGPTYTMTGGSAYDDVRIYPKDAQMSTYTYDGLVGITSSTDTKNETTYYEYDNFRRLMNIKDKDGNIIKHYEYHYNGQ